MSLPETTLAKLSERFRKGWLDLEQTIESFVSADCDRTGRPWADEVKICAARQVVRAERGLSANSDASAIPCSDHYFYWLGYREAAVAVRSGNLPFPESRRESPTAAHLVND